MKKALITGQQAVIANDESSVVAEPGEGALRDPPSLVAAQHPTVLSWRFTPVLPVRAINLMPRAASCLRIAIVTTIGNQPAKLLLVSYPDAWSVASTSLTSDGQQPYRAIGALSGADSLAYSPPPENNYSKFNPLSTVLNEF